MFTRVRTFASVLGTAALVLPFTSAQAAVPPAGHSVTITDPTYPNDTTIGAFNSATMTPTTPTAGKFVDLVKATITTEPRNQLMKFDFVASAPITTANCPVIDRENHCAFVVSLRGVNPATGGMTQYAYEITAQGFVPASRQEAKISSLANPAFSRKLTVTKSSTFGQHIVLWVSTAKFTDARVRFYNPEAKSNEGSIAAVTEYWINARHDSALVADINGAANLPDLAIG